MESTNSAGEERSYDRITAAPGTPEYDRQFDEQVEESAAQAQRVFDSFDIMRYPVVRWFVGAFVFLSTCGFLIDSYQRGELSLRRLVTVLAVSFFATSLISSKPENFKETSS